MISKDFYNISSLRFWDEKSINLRERFIKEISEEVKECLWRINKAWAIHRYEGPILTPRSFISSSYSDDDIFVTNHKDFVLRAETTPSSYTASKRLTSQGVTFPICVWQSGKSFRRETNDGASAAKLRFNEFYQLEFQCIYSDTTKAEYQIKLLSLLKTYITKHTKLETRIVESDRLPSYSNSTLDLEVLFGNRWTEVSSCSIRNDFQDGFLVTELAIGLDRLVEMVTHDHKVSEQVPIQAQH